LSNRCIIAYDSDDAGRAAARRSGELALSLGMEVKIASIPEGADPADVILKSAEEWKELLKNSVNLIEFAIDEAVRKTNNNINLAKEVNNSVIPLLSRLQSEMLRSLFVGIASKKTKIPEKSIWVDIEKYTSKSPRVGHVEGESQSSIEPILFSPEEMLAGIIFWQSSKHKSAEGAPPELTENSYKFDEIRVRFEAIVGTEAASLILENSRFDKDTLIFETEARLSGADPYKAAEELLLRIERTVLEQSLFDTARELDKASTALEKEKLRDEAKEISKRISEISNQ
jgi:DNA primase